MQLIILPLTTAQANEASVSSINLNNDENNNGGFGKVTVIDDKSLANGEEKIGLLRLPVQGQDPTHPELFTWQIFPTAAGQNISIMEANVGIGTTTPNATLDVRDSIVLSSAVGTKVVSKIVNTGNAGFWLSPKRTDGTSWVTNIDSNYTTIGDNLWNTAGSTENTLEVRGNMVVGKSYGQANSPAPTNGMLIEGNVGIGTTTPGAKLDVNGTILSGFIYLNNDPNGVYGMATGGQAGDWGTRLLAFDHFIFNETRTNTTLMKIAKGGNVGIGTTSPSEKLDVEGNLQINNNLIKGATLLGDTLYYQGENILGTVYDKLIRADQKYTVTPDKALRGGSVANMFDGDGDSDANWDDADLPVAININFNGMKHYWTGLAIGFPYGRRVAGVKIWKYYDSNSSNGWDSDCNNDQKDVIWSVVYETTTNDQNTIMVRDNLGNGICEFKIALSGTPAYSNDTRIGEIAGWQYYYGSEGSFVRVTGDTMYGGLTVINGNVSIGATSPSAKLYVQGGSYTVTGNSNNAAYAIGATSIAADTSIYSYGRICAGNYDGDCSNTNTARGGIGVVISNTGIRFPDNTVQTTAAVSGGPDLWVENGTAIYYNNGNVGIGTGNPREQLHVGNGGDSSGATNPNMIVTTTGNSGIAVRDSANDIELDLVTSSGFSSGLIGTQTNHNLGITTNNTIKMTVTPGGNVGIGTATPSAKLEVVESSNKAGLNKGVSITSENTGAGPNWALYVRSDKSETNQDSIGIYAAGLGGQDNYGVYGTTNDYAGKNYGIKGLVGDIAGTSGEGYGVYGEARGSGTNYGVYGKAEGGTTNWAGYFVGDVTVSSNIETASLTLGSVKRTSWPSYSKVDVDMGLDGVASYAMCQSGKTIIGGGCFCCQNSGVQNNAILWSTPVYLPAQDNNDKWYCSCTKSANEAGCGSNSDVYHRTNHVIAICAG